MSIIISSINECALGATVYRTFKCARLKTQKTNNTRDIKQMFTTNTVILPCDAQVSSYIKNKSFFAKHLKITK